MESLTSYQNPIDHIEDELDRIKLIFELAKNRYDTSSLDEYQNKIDQKRNYIDSRLSLSREQGFVFPIERLQITFGLEPVEIDILLLCLGDFIRHRYYKLKYQRLLAPYNASDEDARHEESELTINVIMAAFVGNPLYPQELEEHSQLSSFLSDNSSLLYWDLIHLKKNSNYVNPGFFANLVCIDETIAWFLLNNYSEETADYVNIIPYCQLSSLYLMENQLSKLVYWLDYLKKHHKKRNHLFFFYGPDDGAKKKTASAISYSMNMKLVELDLKLLLNEKGKDFKTVSSE